MGEEGQKYHIKKEGEASLFLYWKACLHSGRVAWDFVNIPSAHHPRWQSGLPHAQTVGLLGNLPMGCQLVPRE